MDFVSDASDILGSLWLYPAGALMVMFPAIIPPIPSTTLFVTLGAVAGLQDDPNAFLLGISMLAGAVAGDFATYWGTKQFGHTRLGTAHGPRRQRAVDDATRTLHDRPFVFLLRSRFIPLGRLSANLAATVAGYTPRAYAAYSVTSALVWSLYSVGVGIGTRLVPGLSVPATIAIAGSIALGWLLGNVATFALDRKNLRRATDAAP